MRIDQLLTLLNGVDFGAFPRVDSTDIVNLDRARPLLLTLAEAPELETFVRPLVDSAIFQTNRDSLHISQDERSAIQGAVARLHFAIMGLRETLKIHAPPADAESIVIKLPDPSDFADALAVMGEFRTAIDQVIVNDTIGGHIRLLGWEIGSLWLYLALGSPAAVTLIGSIAWAAAVVRKKILEGSVLKKQVEAMQIKNDALAAVSEGVQRQVKLLVETEARAIYDKYFSGEDPEQLQRLQFSIKTFSELLAKGAEVHPSLQAPEQVSNLFPDAKKLDTIATKIAELTDKASDGR